jgi:teichuronic acid biosynthesis protein TuaE
MVVILLFFKNKVILSNSLFKSINIFLLILVITTYIEWNYQIHFSFSRVLEMNPIYNYIPTAYYTNQNDLMAIYSMMLLYSLVYMSYFNINNFFYKIYYIFISIYGVILSIVTSSRIGLVSIILLIMIFLFKQKKIIVFFVLTILLIIFYIYSDIIMDYYYLNRLNSGNSTSIRINLYKDAIENITIFGYGFDNSDLFYTQLNDSNLLGIINPHNYLLELLINNGFLFFIFYFLLNIFLFIQSILYKKYILAFAFIMYYFILLSSSSSLFLFQHYIFYISFIVLLQIKKEKNE